MNRKWEGMSRGWVHGNASPCLTRVVPPTSSPWLRRCICSFTSLLFFVLFASLSFAVSFVRRFRVFPRSFFSFYIASLFGTTYSSFFFGSLCRLKNFHRSWKLRRWENSSDGGMSSMLQTLPRRIAAGYHRHKMKEITTIIPELRPRGFLPVITVKEKQEHNSKDIVHRQTLPYVLVQAFLMLSKWLHPDLVVPEDGEGAPKPTPILEATKALWAVGVGDVSSPKPYRTWLRKNLQVHLQTYALEHANSKVNLDETKSPVAQISIMKYNKLKRGRPLQLTTLASWPNSERAAGPRLSRGRNTPLRLLGLARAVSHCARQQAERTPMVTGDSLLLLYCPACGGSAFRTKANFSMIFLRFSAVMMCYCAYLITDEGTDAS